jgi:hypothetical protein
MKLLISVILFSLFFTKSYSQSFHDWGSVVGYMEGKTFNNSTTGVEISYSYISDYNNYGIIVKNKHGTKFHYINVEISPYGSSADLNGMSPIDGSNFGFRLFRGRLIVGYGEAEQVTFTLK